MSNGEATAAVKSRAFEEHATAFALATYLCQTATEISSTVGLKPDHYYSIWRQATDRKTNTVYAVYMDPKTGAEGLISLADLNEMLEDATLVPQLSPNTSGWSPMVVKGTTDDL